MPLITRPGVPRARKFSKAEYHEMTERGFFDGQRVELMNGEIIEMAAQKDSHAFGVRLSEAAARRVFGDGYVVMTQLPIDAGDAGEPEPDVAVIEGDLRDITSHPTRALLIIEVSDTTLAYDRVRKASLYASRKVPDYWIVNLIDQTVEVHRKPVRDPGAEFGWSYERKRVFRKGDTVSPNAKKGVKIAVGDLLP